MREEAVLFGGKTALVGVITYPTQARNYPAVLFLNAGGLHRVGPSRLYVDLARTLADSGFLVLRFDFSGFGDSDPRNDGMPFTKSAVTDVRLAMDYLTTTKGIDRFILIGICSGADAAFGTARCDSRVAGAVLINGTGYDAASGLNFNPRSLGFVMRTMRFFATAWPHVIVRKLKRGFWGGANTAHVSLFLLRNLLRGSGSSANQAETSMRDVAGNGVELLLVYEGEDPAVDYLRALVGGGSVKGSCRPHVIVEVVKGADHAFNSLNQQRVLTDLICKWTMRWRDVPAYEPACDSLVI